LLNTGFREEEYLTPLNILLSRQNDLYRKRFPIAWTLLNSDTFTFHLGI
jgi:hypothetical protein